MKSINAYSVNSCRRELSMHVVAFLSSGAFQPCKRGCAYMGNSVCKNTRTHVTRRRMIDSGNL